MTVTVNVAELEAKVRDVYWHVAQEPGDRFHFELMCGHGERAMGAASLLERAGHGQVAVLDCGPEQWAAASGQPLEVTA